MIIKFDPVPYFCDYANAEVTPKMGSYSDGAYVLATDYAALEAERDEWKRRTYRIVGHIEEADSIDLHAIIAIAEGRDNG